MRLPSSHLIQRAALTSLCGLALTVTAHGQLSHEITFDDNSYPAGFDLNALGGADLGFGTNLWFDGAAPGTGSFILPGSLTDPQGQLPTSGNHVSTAVTGFNLGFYSFDLNAANGSGEPEDALAPGEHWISFLARADANADFAGVSLVKFFGDEQLYIGKVGGAGSNTWGLDQGASGSVAVAGSDATTDTLLVAKVTIGAGGNDDFVDLFINPTLGTLPTTPDIAAYQFNEDPNLLNGDGNRIRQIDELRIGSQNGPFQVDEIRIGSTFFDVTIPPITGGLLAGDYNDSGSVEQGDLDLVLNNWGGPRTAGFVANADGFATANVDQEELDRVLNNWGSSNAPSFSGSPVPEPAVAALLGLGGLALTRRRSR